MSHGGRIGALMEPRIQYAKTSDGVSIALWTMGAGMPVVHMPSPPTTISQVLWQMAAFRRAFERHAEKRIVVRFDNRGFGHSERDVSQFSLEAWLLDLEAVVDHLSLERFALSAMVASAPIAMAYAARYPERLSHLILWNASARGRDSFDVERTLAMLAVADADWEFYTEATAHGLLGWSAGEEGPRFAAALREGQTPAALRAAFETMIEIDVSDLLPQIATPTLVLHQRDALHPEVDIGRRLVARIPNAQLVVLHGKAHPYFEESEPFFRAIDEFLEGVEPATDDGHAPAGLVTILFTDLTSSTALTQRLGDAKAQELVRAHNAIVREALKSSNGTEIKHTGDGIMASFPTASGALECAVAIQRAVGARDDADLQVHVGLNAGEPVAEESDLFGTSVQLARRICDHAEAGQILVSNVVRELAAGKDFLFADIGEVVPKGFEEPVRLYEVRWREEE